MMIERLKTFGADKIHACKILVVGDVMLDKYYFGGNVTLHPTGAPRFQIVRALSPRVGHNENFCGRF